MGPLLLAPDGGTTVTIVGVEAQEFPNDDAPLVDEGDTDLSMFVFDAVPNWGKIIVAPFDALDIIDAEQEDIVDNVGEAAAVFLVRGVEAHNDDDGGNEDSEDDEDSDIPAIDGLEVIVGVSTDLWEILVSFAFVIVRDKSKFEEMFVDETDVCDKSVGSESKKRFFECIRQDFIPIRLSQVYRLNIDIDMQEFSNGTISIFNVINFYYFQLYFLAVDNGIFKKNLWGHWKWSE